MLKYQAVKGQRRYYEHECIKGLSVKRITDNLLCVLYFRMSIIVACVLIFYVLLVKVLGNQRSIEIGLRLTQRSFILFQLFEKGRAFGVHFPLFYILYGLYLAILLFRT